MAVSYAPRNEATSDLFYYIAVFYNRSRRHSNENLALFEVPLRTSIRFGTIAKTAAALVEKALTCMERIAAMPDRVRSYLSHEYVRYAQ